MRAVYIYVWNKKTPSVKYKRIIHHIFRWRCDGDAQIYVVHPYAEHEFLTSNEKYKYVPTTKFESENCSHLDGSPIINYN